MLWGLTRRVVTLFILQVFLPVTTNNILFQELCRGNLIGCPLPSIQWVVNIVNITASNCLHIIFWTTYLSKSVMSLTNSKIMQGLFFVAYPENRNVNLFSTSSSFGLDYMSKYKSVVSSNLHLLLRTDHPHSLRLQGWAGHCRRLEGNEGDLAQ